MISAKKHPSSEVTGIGIEEVLELFLIKLRELDERLDKLENRLDFHYQAIPISVSG